MKGYIMKEKLKKFTKTSLVYFLGNTFTKILAFILLPLFTNKLDPVEYGEYGLVISIITTIVPLAFLGIWDGMFRIAFEKDDFKYRHYVINNSFFIMLVGSVICTVVIVIVSRIMGWNHMVFIVVYGIANAFQYFYSMSVRSLNDSRFFVFSGCISSVTYMLISLLFIGNKGMGTEVLYIAYAIGTLFQIVILEIKDKILFLFKISDLNKEFICRLIRFSTPQAISSVMNWFFLGFAQVMISWKLGAYYNGQYNVASKFSSIIILLANVVQFAWYELAYELAEEKTAKLKYKIVMESISKIIFTIYPVVILTVKIIYPFFIGESYQESLHYIPIILLSTIFSTIVSFSITVFLALKDSKSIMISNIFSAILNVILLFLVTDFQKMKGVLVSLCLVNIFNFIFKLLQLRKQHQLKIKIPFYLLLIDVISIIIFFWFDDRKILLSFGIVFLVSAFLVLKNTLKIVGRRSSYED